MIIEMMVRHIAIIRQIGQDDNFPKNCCR